MRVGKDWAVGIVVRSGWKLTGVSAATEINDYRQALDGTLPFPLRTKEHSKEEGAAFIDNRPPLRERYLSLIL